MPRSSQSETSSGSPPTYRTRFPIEIPFVTYQLVERASLRCTNLSASTQADPVLRFSEETCAQRRAETRASIAQDPEGETEGARDRVVTGLHLGLP